MADTIDTLYSSITAAIQAQFPELVTVEFDCEDRKGLRLPACLLEITEMENAPDDDNGTGQLPMECRFTAEIILGFKTPKVKREIRKLAAAMAVWLRMRRWPGVPCNAARVIGAYTDEFRPELDQFEVWRVEWSQVVHMGAEDDGDGQAATDVRASWSPRIGAAHEAEYKPILEAVTSGGAE